MNQAPNLVAGGNIPISSFCKVSTAADNTALAAVSGDMPIGVSAQSIHDANATYHATSGQGVTLFGLGEVCLIQAGSGGFAHGDLLKPDNTSAAITANTSDYFGAVALESTSYQNFGRCQVLFGKK